MIIGHFGFGFYSSFMVARQVELVNLSTCEGAEAVRWNCDGTRHFSLEASERSEHGTDGILHLIQQELQYTEPVHFRTLITTYYVFTPEEMQLE